VRENSNAESEAAPAWPMSFRLRIEVSEGLGGLVGCWWVSVCVFVCLCAIVCVCDRET
jgi:hypothetical protein